MSGTIFLASLAGVSFSTLMAFVIKGLKHAIEEMLQTLLGTQSVIHLLQDRFKSVV